MPKQTLTIVKGWGASLGKVQGKVRVVLEASECHLLADGEVLVTTMTSPAFVPALKKAGAVVTDFGGVTCHAAIISREFEIPCIVGTTKATTLLKTGDLVEVDANQGVVRVLKR